MEELGFVHRIHDAFAGRLGHKNVALFDDQFQSTGQSDEILSSATTGIYALVIVIGPRWLTDLKSANGRAGQVHQLIAMTLRRGIRVFPVQVGRLGDLARMPESSELPDDIRKIGARHSHAVTHERFGRDVAELIDFIGDFRRESWLGRSVKRVYAPIIFGVISAVATLVAEVVLKATPVIGFKIFDLIPISFFPGLLYAAAFAGSFALYARLNLALGIASLVVGLVCWPLSTTMGSQLTSLFAGVTPNIYLTAGATYGIIGSGSTFITLALACKQLRRSDVALVMLTAGAVSGMLLGIAWNRGISAVGGFFLQWQVATSAVVSWYLVSHGARAP